MTGIKRLALKRRRLRLTNYSLRKSLILSKKPRLVVRISNRYIYAALTLSKPEGDFVLASASSKELKKFGWVLSFKNLSAAYLTGVLLTKKALKKELTEAVLDIGLSSPTKGNRIFAFVKACNDFGLKVPLDESVTPDENRIKGVHIVGYMKQSMQGIQFSKVKGILSSPDDVVKIFEKTLEKLKEVK
ncbi:MAG: 50S ribosomal protein L18 [Candidatus Brockarchaeota archaeon]|nr:50S ribosomal protein L18 [Candidatus Brockarchaeota archaeon]MBO3768726.1 50S ribosomal protein L18 [Candidatus Brockarchaeota archaeon]